MADPTTNYSWDKPLNGADLDTWGNKLRDFMDDADADLFAGLAAKQAAHAKLTALAGLTGGDLKMPIFTGTDSMSQTDLTVFARTLLDDANAATARGTLGLGNVKDIAVYVQSGNPGVAPAGSIWIVT